MHESSAEASMDIPWNLLCFDAVVGPHSLHLACRAATAAVVADMGIPLDRAASQQLGPQQKEEGIKKLAEASAALNDNRQAAAEVASGLGRTSIGREHREQVGTSVASTMGFPAPFSRRCAQTHFRSDYEQMSNIA